MIKENAKVAKNTSIGNYTLRDVCATAQLKNIVPPLRKTSTVLYKEPRYK